MQHKLKSLPKENCNICEEPLQWFGQIEKPPQIDVCMRCPNKNRPDDMHVQEIFTVEITEGGVEVWV